MVSHGATEWKKPFNRWQFTACTVMTVGAFQCVCLCLVFRTVFPHMRCVEVGGCFADVVTLAKSQSKCQPFGSNAGDDIGILAGSDLC